MQSINTVKNNGPKPSTLFLTVPASPKFKPRPGYELRALPPSLAVSTVTASSRCRKLLHRPLEASSGFFPTSIFSCTQSLTNVIRTRYFYPRAANPAMCRGPTACSPPPRFTRSFSRLHQPSRCSNSKLLRARPHAVSALFWRARPGHFKQLCRELESLLTISLPPTRRKELETVY